MSGNSGETAPKETLSVRDNANADADADSIYHVRLIQSWPPSKTCHALTDTLASSFYGLQLELRSKTKDPTDSHRLNDQSGSKNDEIVTSAAVQLHFGPHSPLPTQLETLNAMTGPFEVVVYRKLTDSVADTTDGQVIAALQQMASVQVDNTLLEINGERFVFDADTTGADIYRRLQIVALRASLAIPFELTLRRHNFAQVSVKIVPFARRRDVQDAQLAQLAKILAEDAALPAMIRRKKLFLLHQLDFEREHYLVAHVSDPLQELHTKIMGDGQWQAFEFGKTLWYFHAPTSRLYAQHPLRNHPEARNLIEQVQKQVQGAARRLQRRIRSYQRRKRLMSIIQTEMQRQEAKRRERQHSDAARRIQRRLRVHQRRKRFLATIKAAKSQREDEQAGNKRQEEQRAEANRQVEATKLEHQRLQQELAEMKLELQILQMLKASKLSVESETQTRSSRKTDDTIDPLEQQRIQERLEKLESEMRVIRERNSTVEAQTQAFDRCNESDSAQHVTLMEQRRRIQELEMKLQQQDTSGSVAPTKHRRRDNFRDGNVDTANDLDWQRDLALLRITIKNKRKSPKKQHKQMKSVNSDKAHSIASSMLRASPNADSFSTGPHKPIGTWKGLPPWHRGDNGRDSHSSTSTKTLRTAQSSSSQFTESDPLPPPTRTFESFFAPDVTMTHGQSSLSLVDRQRRQDSMYLPRKSSRKLLEVAPVYYHPEPHEYQEPVNRPMSPTGFMHDFSASTIPTKLPYIMRRR